MKALTIPMLFVTAESDAIVDSKEVYEETYQAYRGPKQHVLLPGAHYMEFTEAQDQLVYETVSWIDQH